MRYQRLLQNQRERPWKRSGSYEYYGYGAVDEPTAQPLDVAVAAVASPVVPTTPAASQEPVVVVEPATHDPSEIAASVGQQILSLSAGAAACVAAFVMGFKLKNATRMNTVEVITASLISMSAAFFAIYAIKTYH